MSKSRKITKEMVISELFARGVDDDERGDYRVKALEVCARCLGLFEAVPVEIPRVTIIDDCAGDVGGR